MKQFCIDASVFLGMNSNDEIVRVSCKNFFIENQDSVILMSFEQIGVCDNIIWSCTFEQQIMYYPFMDLLHTIMPIKRFAFTVKTLNNLKENKAIPLTARLNVAFAKEHNALIYSAHSSLMKSCAAITKIPGSKIEKKFNDQLESYYQDSLTLRIDFDTIFKYA